MTRKIVVSLLVTFVFLDVVEIVPTNHNGSFHLHAFHNARQDATANRYIASERTFLVNVCSFNSLISRCGIGDVDAHIQEDKHISVYTHRLIYSPLSGF